MTKSPSSRSGAAEVAGTPAYPCDPLISMNPTKAER
jgi:hypothetical protein